MQISSDGRIEKSRYWHLGEMANLTKIDEEPFEWFEYYFNRSIKYRMVSDVPVGVLLSGGLDSSSIAYSLSNQGYENINTFTIRFNEKELDEAQLATSFSKKIGFNSHSLLVEGDDLYENLVKSVWSHDEPLIHHSDPHLVAISQYSKDYVKVLLSGEGADELMGGYVRYKPLKYFNVLNNFSTFIKALPFNNIDRFYKLKQYLNDYTGDQAILLNASNFFPKRDNIEFENENNINYRKEILREAGQFMGSDLIKKALYYDQHTYLVSLLNRNDRSTMAAGIECREPFLDYTIVEGLASLPTEYFVKGKKGKYILYNSVGKHLPEEIRNFKKIGLGVPWDKYLRGQEKYRNILLSVNESEILNYELFQMYDKKKIIDSYLNGDNSNKMLVRFFFFIRLWEIEYIAKF
jgi:asparagine synthase (glutamine-hydrolysing)